MSEQDRSNPAQINVRSGLATLRAPTLQNVPSLATVSKALSTTNLTAISAKYSGTNPEFSRAVAMIVKSGTAMEGAGVLPLQVAKIREIAKNNAKTGEAA